MSVNITSHLTYHFNNFLLFCLVQLEYPTIHMTIDLFIKITSMNLSAAANVILTAEATN